MKLKKTVSVLAVLALSFGVFAGFSGCGREITAADVNKKIFEESAATEITGYEMKTERSRVFGIEMKNYAEKSSAEESVLLTYYEEENVFADCFTQSEYYKEVTAPSHENTERQNRFGIGFCRGEDGYSFSDSWKGVGLKKGNFGGMVSKLREGGEFVLTKGSPTLSDKLSANSFSDIASSMQTLDADVTKTGEGYEAKLDFVKSAERLLRGMSGLIFVYEKNPSMTVREFFADEFAAKLVKQALEQDGPYAGFSALSEMIFEATGRRLSSSTEYYNDAENGAQAFYACLESKMLFTVLSQTAPSGVNTAEISSKDGTVGGMKASALLGSPGEVKKEVAKAAANPEKFLLEAMLDFDNGEKDEGSFKMVTTVTLDRGLRVTGMKTVMKTSYKDYDEHEEDGKDGEEEYTTQSVSSETTVKILKKAPVLTVLTGMKVDVGSRLKPGAYELKSENEALRGYSSKGGSKTWTGAVSLAITVSETEARVAARFTADGLVIDETRTYDISDGRSVYDNEYLFSDEGYSYQGAEYELFGIRYGFQTDFSYGSFSLGYDAYLSVPTERAYLTL